VEASHKDWLRTVDFPYLAVVAVAAAAAAAVVAVDKRSMEGPLHCC